jgi:hypothetical protein
MKTKLLIMVSVLALFGATSGFAQLGEVVRANIPFQFTVGSKLLPAGEYDFNRDALDTAIRVVSVKPGQDADVLVVTRLAAEIHHSQRDSHIVFDKVGDKYILAEFWIPEADGYLLNITKGQHTHRTVMGSKKG